jgi:hypothetical protein
MATIGRKSFCDSYPKLTRIAHNSRQSTINYIILAYDTRIWLSRLLALFNQ